MKAYDESYAEQIMYTQADMFMYVVRTFPNYDVDDFITKYMKSNTRRYLDHANMELASKDVKDLYEWFVKFDNYKPKAGNTFDEYRTGWIGAFYSYAQWYYNIPSEELVEKIPIDLLKESFSKLISMDIEKAVKTVGKQLNIKIVRTKGSVCFKLKKIAKHSFKLRKLNGSTEGAKYSFSPGKMAKR